LRVSRPTRRWPASMPPSFRFPVIRGRPSRPRLRRDCSLTGAQNNPVHALPATGRAAAKGPQPAGADIPHLAQPVDREGPTLLFDEPEPHRFWLAKNWVAFFQDLPFRRENNPPDCFADPAQILKDADLAPKPLFSGQARGPLLRPHPCRDGRSPMGSRSTRRPPDHPQSDVAKARSSVQCAPHPCETHPSCLCPGFISFAAHCAIKGAPPSRDRSSFVRAELYTTPTYLTTSEVLRLVARLILSRAPPTEVILPWSFWRRQHQANPANAHRRRRA
jgi:hypothetical protein